MSHELYTDSRGTQFIANDGKPGWHSLGTVRAVSQSFRDAIDELRGGATWTIDSM